MLLDLPSNLGGFTSVATQNREQLLPPKEAMPNVILFNDRRLQESLRAISDHDVHLKVLSKN